MKTTSDPPSSEITPESVYLNRRNFMKAGVLAASVAATGRVYRRLNSPSTQAVDTPEIEVAKTTAPANSGFGTGEAQTSLQDITHYNNFYEFSTDKDGVADGGGRFQDLRLEGRGRRNGEQTASIRSRRLAEDRARGRARLPDALRRGVVDGDPLGRLLAVATAGTRRTPEQRQVRSHADAARSAANAGTEYERLGLALRRGIAIG